MLSEIDRLAKQRTDFSFESTLSGLGYVRRLKNMRAAGYHIEIIYLRLRSPRLALRRVAARVRQGGHDVSKADLLRRFTRNLKNFESVYKALADV